MPKPRDTYSARQDLVIDAITNIEDAAEDLVGSGSNRYQRHQARKRLLHNALLYASRVRHLARVR